EADDGAEKPGNDHRAVEQRQPPRQRPFPSHADEAGPGGEQQQRQRGRKQNQNPSGATGHDTHSRQPSARRARSDIMDGSQGGSHTICTSMTRTSGKARRRADYASARKCALRGHKGVVIVICTAMSPLGSATALYTNPKSTTLTPSSGSMTARKASRMRSSCETSDMAFPPSKPPAAGRARGRRASLAAEPDPGRS